MEKKDNKDDEFGDFNEFYFPEPDKNEEKKEVNGKAKK